MWGAAGGHQVALGDVHGAGVDSSDAYDGRVECGAHPTVGRRMAVAQSLHGLRDNTARSQPVALRQEKGKACSVILLIFRLLMLLFLFQSYISPFIPPPVYPSLNPLLCHPLPSRFLPHSHPFLQSRSARQPVPTLFCRG